MLNLSLTAVHRGEVRVGQRVAPDDPVWEGSGIALREPLAVDLVARPVGEGVLVRGRIRAPLRRHCRRCLTDVPVEVDEEIDLLYEPLSGEEATDLAGEVYPLPERGDVLDLLPAVREQVLLRVPEFVVCRAACRGLCPQCGANWNDATCECEPEAGPSPWAALKDLKFD